MATQTTTGAVTVRSILVQEIEQIVPLLYRFQDETTYKHCAPTSQDELAGILRSMFTDPDRFMLFVAQLDERLIGFCFGVIGQAHLFLPHVKVVQEFAWWVVPEHRSSSAGARLLYALKQWAIKEQVQVFSYGKPLTAGESKPGYFHEEIVRVQLGGVHV